MIGLTPTAVVADGLVAPRSERRSAQILGRFAVREHGRAFWATLWVAALAGLLAALAPLVTGDPPLRDLDVMFVLAAGSFMACGLIAWRRRPDNHSGRLMTATGFAALIYPLLIQLEAPLATTLAMLFSATWTIGYVALLLSFRTGGRLEGIVDWLLVGVVTLTLLVAHFALLLVYPAPGNLLLVAENMTVADAINDTARWVTAGASIALVIVLLSRWRGGIEAPAEGAAARSGRDRELDPVLRAARTGHRRGDADEHPLDRGERRGPARARRLPVRAAAVSPGAGGARGAAAEDGDDARGGARGGARPCARRSHLRVVHGDVPPASAGRSVARIDRDGQPVAALVYDESLDDDPELVEAVTAAAAIALENEHIHAESDARLAELHASRERIVAAGDAERRRLERNLHDGAQQRLVALSLELKLLELRFAKDPEAKEAVDAARRELTESLEELRELARGIHPALVTGHGLAVALDSVAARSPVPVTLDVRLEERVPKRSRWPRTTSSPRA